MLARLNHIDTWIFDLDNTLYPASCDLFALIDAKMGLFIQDLLGVDQAAARRIQKGHFHAHGTTLTGLRRDHDVHARDFLDYVHDIPLDRLTPDPALKAALSALPGRRLVFTNGDAPYAKRVLDALDLSNCFEAVFDIYAANLVPKPEPLPYVALCQHLAVAPHRALFAEDMARNLKPAKDLGMTTLWVNNGSEQAEGVACPSFVDHETHDITRWLTNIVEQTLA